MSAETIKMFKIFIGIKIARSDSLAAIVITTTQVGNFNRENFSRNSSQEKLSRRPVICKPSSAHQNIVFSSNLYITPRPVRERLSLRKILLNRRNKLGNDKVVK